METITVEIFNRWGHKMSEWNTIGSSWDGYNFATGIKSPAGTYFYVITATDIDERTYIQQGSFILIR